MSKESLKVSLNLWSSFARHAQARICSLRSPFTVQDTERIGRALFSGHVTNSGKIRPNAFSIRPPDYEYSVNRLSCAPREQFVRLSKLDAVRRSIAAAQRDSSKTPGITFKGFAEFLESDLRKIKIDGSRPLYTSSDVTCANPFHGVIGLEPDQTKDYELAVTDNLLAISAFTSEG